MIVVSGPSGSGKTTLCDLLLEWSPAMRYSVSCTTRPPRPGEIDGTDYFFVSEEEFDRRLRDGEFMEHAVVHGHHYATPIAAVERLVAEGADAIMDIDVQGAASIRAMVRSGDALAERLRRAFVDIFIAPPTSADLEQRLRRRNTDDERTIQCRLVNAKAELRHWRNYTYVVVNDKLDRAVVRMQSIVTAEKSRSERLRPGDVEALA